MSDPAQTVAWGGTLPGGRRAIIGGLGGLSIGDMTRRPYARRKKQTNGESASDRPLYLTCGPNRSVFSAVADLCPLCVMHCEEGPPHFDRMTAATYLGLRGVSYHT